MSGLTPLVDTLLATRLGQRVDLVPLKAQVEIAGPGAVTTVEKVSNDVRLPSREALQRQLTGVLPDRRDAADVSFSQKAAGAVTLSAAARAVSAVLNLPAEPVAGVRGAAPLFPDVHANAVPVLATTLARTVASSGLFYESHLQQYVAGARTLAQMAQEPQARLSPAAARVAAFPAQVHAGAEPLDEGAARAPSPGAPPSAVALAGAVAALPGGDTLALVPALPAAAERGAEASKPPSLPAQQARPASPETAGLAAAYSRVAARASEPGALADLVEPDSEAASADTAAVKGLKLGDPVAAIHPEAVALVRQQLEMLAVPVFRWSGEGWPGVPMAWEIHEQPEDPQDQKADHAGEEAPPEGPAWTTRVTLQLPRLGAVDMRLSLSGTALQVRLAALVQTTAALLDASRDVLPQRFGALGLQLTGLHMDAWEQESTAMAAPGGQDAA